VNGVLVGEDEVSVGPVNEQHVAFAILDAEEL